MNKMNKIFPIVLCPFFLSGCALTAGIGQVGQIGQQIPGVVADFDNTINALILQKKIGLHNLQVGLEQIDKIPGMVTMQNMPVPAPVPTAPPAPQPVPQAPQAPTSPSPSAPPSTPSSGPVVTPTVVTPTP
jgi:hypothetical protein